MKKFILMMVLSLSVVGCGGPPDSTDPVDPPVVTPPLPYEPYVAPAVLKDPSGGGNCVAPETLILMADGTSKSASAVVVGDVVLSRQAFNGLGQPGEKVGKRVTRTLTYDSNTRVKIVFKDGFPDLVATARHRLLWNEGSFYEAGTLTPGTGIFGITSWDHMGDAPIGAKPMAYVDHLEAYPDGPAVLIEIEDSEWTTADAFGYFTNGYFSYDPPDPQ